MVRVFRVFVPTTIFTLLVSELLLLTFCYVLAAFLALEVDPTVFLLYDGGLPRILPVVLTILFGLHFFDLYSEVGVRSRVAVALEIGQAIGLAFIAEAFLSYANRNWMLPRGLMLYGSALSLACLTLWRTVYIAIAVRMFGHQRVLFLGWSTAIQEIAAHLESHPEVGITNLGYVDGGHPPGEVLCGAPVLGPLDQVRRIAGQIKPDRIVVGVTERRGRLPVQDLLELKFSGIHVEEAATTYEVLRGRVSIKELRLSQLVFSGEWGPRRELVILQSLYSAVIALAATLVTLPVMLLTAVAVKLTSRGPILYRQQRVGLRGRAFVIYKFRSMYADAEARTGAVWAAKDDPRITPVGRWLRKLRLDELPQLLNVLRGEMSIVGPRPERPEFVRILAEQIPFYHQRHCVKPGITGWAQVNYRYGDTVEDAAIKLEYDLYYIKHLSPALDAFVLFHTVKTMLRFRGAQ